MLLQTIKAIRDNNNLPKNSPTSLRTKLQSYGLSPQDWQIEAQDSKYLITHIENEDFKFVGYSTQDEQDWKSIHLYSL